MWIMTTRGFYSAVEHRDNSNQLLVRARSRADLVNLVDVAEERLPQQVSLSYADIQETTRTGADYPFRITIGKEEFQMLMDELVSDIDYDNFKNAVAAIDGGNHARAHTYGSVWSVLHQIEHEPTAGVYKPPRGMGRPAKPAPARR